VLFSVQQLPWTFHVYILFPYFFWQDVTRKVHANWSAVIRDSTFDAKWIASTLFGLFLAVAALQSMVVRFFKRPTLACFIGFSARDVQFGYTDRAVWSVGFVVVGVVWPLTSWPKGRGKLFWPWAASCVTTAVFPLLSVDPSESLGTM
jgi:phosphatidylinositol glycan class N